MDWGAYNIICEEIASYYTQNRSVEQIAETLDARLTLYIQENYSWLLGEMKNESKKISLNADDRYINVFNGMSFIFFGGE